MIKNISGSRPKESFFYDPLIYLIGKLTNFQPYKGVEHTLLRDDVLRLVDIDPENSPWPLKSESTKNRNGLYRVVHFAWYHQTRKYRPEAEALCAKPAIESERLRGMWALTELGVKKAKSLREKYEGKIVLSKGPNTTAVFIGNDFNKLYSRITYHLRRKMPRSELFNKIDDHAMSWIERVIQRDGLRTRIESGKAVPPSQICSWARRGAYTDIRDESTEPVCRVFHGALTKKEFKALESVNWIEEVIPRTINESEVLANNQYAAHSEEDTLNDPIESIADTHDFARVEESFTQNNDFKRVWESLDRILHTELSKGHDPEFHKQVLYDRFVNGMTVREIVEANGLDFSKDETKIKVVLNRAREAVNRARAKGQLDEFLSF